jgi:RNA polymerase sigma-70 factor (ECF subfamily)
MEAALASIRETSLPLLATAPPRRNFSALACHGFPRHKQIAMETEKDAAKLIVAIAERGDRDAFAALFDHYAPRIKTFLLRRGAGEHLAEDMAQEAMLSVWRKAGSFDEGRATASAWIFTSARNLGIDQFRREQRAAATGHLDLLDTDNPDRPDDLLLDHDMDTHVRTALGQVPPDQRRVVELSFFEGKAHGEISEALGIPLGTVKSRLRLAFGRLRKLLDGLS